MGTARHPLFGKEAESSGADIFREYKPANQLKYIKYTQEHGLFGKTPVRQTDPALITENCRRSLSLAGLEQAISDDFIGSLTSVAKEMLDASFAEARVDAMSQFVSAVVAAFHKSSITTAVSGLSAVTTSLEEMQCEIQRTQREKYNPQSRR